MRSRKPRDRADHQPIMVERRGHLVVEAFVIVPLDRAGAGTIAVMPVPSEGLGEAINDRLTRAAALR